VYAPEVQGLSRRFGAVTAGEALKKTNYWNTEQKKWLSAGWKYLYHLETLGF